MCREIAPAGADLAQLGECDVAQLGQPRQASASPL
jgi:hypothetical protein